MNKQNQNEKDIGELEKNKDIQIENKTKVKIDKKTAILLSVLSVLIIVFQTICKLVFNFEVELNIIVDCVSIIIAALIVFGVLKIKTNSKNLLETQKQIKEQISNEVEKISSKNKK